MMQEQPDEKWKDMIGFKPTVSTVKLLNFDVEWCRPIFVFGKVELAWQITC